MTGQRDLGLFIGCFHSDPLIGASVLAASARVAFSTPSDLGQSGLSSSSARDLSG
jgi:hypothetical protein